jgi:hypothetical protein
MSNLNVKINPTGNLELGGDSGLVILASDLSLAGVAASQVQGVLGVVPGTDVQAQSAILDDFATLGAAGGADNYIYSDGAGSFAYGTVTAAGRALLDDADAAAQRTTLSLVPGTDVQVHSAVLEDISNIGPAVGADSFIYSDGAGSFAYGTVTAAGRALLDDADAAAQRTTLGLVIGTDVQAQNGNLQEIADTTFTEGDVIQYSGGALTNVAISSLNSDNTVYTEQTTTDTATAINLTTHATSTTDDVTVFVSAVENGAEANIMVWRAKFAVTTNSGDTTTIIGAQNITLEHNAGTTGWTLGAFTVSGNTLEANVTGANLVSVNWKVSVVRYSTSNLNA